ncbi:UNVERIFIED_CONTAM: YD repeat-containing protein [Acetivibrio alkalicellulosi]
MHSDCAIFFNNKCVYDCPQNDLHGTHVAGIIAAVENELGICGVAPNIKILPVKFINGNSGYTSDAINAIAYAEDMGASIANISWGGTQYNQALKDSMENSSMLFVCAAGNNGLDTSSAPIYPANFDLPNIISVGALNNRGSLAYFSSYGIGVDVAAPGTEIISTLPEGNYGKLSGSSMAAPFVTGIAALLISIEPDITSSDMADRIKTNVVVSPKLSGKVASGGRVDADAVLRDIIPSPEEDLPAPTPTPDPSNGEKNIEDFINIIECNSLEANGKEMKPVIFQNNIENVESRDISFPLDNGLDTVKSDIDTQSISPLSYIYEEEGNNTSSTAMSVGIGTIFATINSLYESNWFTVYLEENRDYTIRLTGLYQGFDMDLFLYKPNLSYAAHSSYFGNADEIINITPTESGYYYINTYSFEYAGPENNTYQILIYPDDTPPDQHEPNDCIETATLLELDTYIYGTININTDDDWFVVNADKGRLTVSLDWIPSGCDYDIAIYNENMTIVGGSWNGGNLPEKASVFINNPGDYYIRVNSYIGSHASFEYRLKAVNSRPDIHEVNDFYYQAKGVSLGTSIFGTIDSEFDVDWYYIDIEDADNYSFKLQDIPQGCDYDLIVYDSNLQYLGHSFNWWNEDEEVNAYLTPGRYYAYIYSYSGISDANLYRFSVSNENALTLELPRVRGNPGETIQVPVHISNLPPEGISALSFGVNYDKRIFTYLGYEEGQLTDSSDAYIEANEGNSGVRVFYSDNTNTYTAPLVDDGELIKLNFQINSQAQESAYTLAYLPGWSFTKVMPNGSVVEEENVLFKIGVVSVGDFELNSAQSYQQPLQYINPLTGNFRLGDINADGNINTSDYALLRRHILEISLLNTDQLSRADLNGDGNVNSTDLILLRRFILEIINVFPASRIVSLSTDNHQPEVGDIITVSLDISNIDNFAGYQANIIYDPLVIEPLDYDTEEQYSKDTMPKIGNILNSTYEYVEGAYHNLGEGRVNFGRAVKSLSSYKNSGSAETTGNLAKIKFRILREVESTNIKLDDYTNDIYERAEGAIIKQRDIQLFDWDGNSIDIHDKGIDIRNLTISTSPGQQTTMSKPLEYEESNTTGITLSYGSGQEHIIVGYLGVSDPETFDIELFDGGKNNVLTVNNVNIYSDGYFKINFTPSNNGIFTLRISKEGYLSRLVNIYTGMYGIQLGTMEEPLEMWEGDINGDYVIDMEDIMEIIKDLDENSGNYSENDLTNALNKFNRTSEDYPLEKILMSNTAEMSHDIIVPKNTVLNFNNKILSTNQIQNWGTIRLNGGQLYLDGDYNQKENALVSESTPLIDMEDGYMEVGGNVLMNGGTMFMNGGTLYAKKEYQLKNNSALRMVNDSDYVVIEGRFLPETQRSYEGNLVAGTLVLRGNMTINSTPNDNTFLAGGTHRTILTGERQNGSSKQKIIMENIGRPHMFNILILLRPMEEYELEPKNEIFWKYLFIEDIERRRGINDGKHAPTGEYVKSFVDMTSEAPGFEVVFSRKYNSVRDKEGSFGKGWTFGFDSKIEYSNIEHNNQSYGSYYEVELPDRMRYSFLIKDNEYISYNTRATLEKDGNTTLILTTKDQYKYFYVGNDNAGYVLNKMEDRVGNYITIKEDEDNINIKIIKDITGRQYEVEYSQGRIEKICDLNAGREVVYSYDAGKLQTVTYPMGKVIEYEYNDDGLLKAIKNEVSENVYETIESIGYVNNKMETLTDEYGAVKKYTYNESETIIVEEDSYGNKLRKTVLEYDFSLLVNQKSIYRYENQNEILESESSVFYTDNRMFAEERKVVDINGNTTTYRRDNNGNIIKIINPDGSNKEFGYDNKNNMIWEKDEEGRFTIYEYEYLENKLIRKAQRIESLSPQDTIPSISSINSQDYRITEYEYYNYSDTPNNETTYKVYGLLKKETVIMPGDNIITEYGYHANGKLKWIKDPETGQKTQYSDEINLVNGWKKTVTTPLGNVTEYHYNNDGQIVKEILRDDETSSTSVIVYDNLGRKVQEISPNLYDEHGGVDLPTNIGYRYEYKGVSNLVEKITDPQGYITEFDYDIFGNIKRETRDNGSIYEYEYDVLGRLRKKSFRKNSASSPVVLEKYDYEQKIETGEGHYLYEKVHTKYFDTNEFARTTYLYDYAGREVYRENADGGIVNTEYYKNGRVKSVSDLKNSDHKTIYNYDMYLVEDGYKNNYNEKWTPFRVDDNGTLLYSYSITVYDRAGRVKRVGVSNDRDGVIYGVVPQNLMTTEYTYYKNGKVESVTSSNGKITNYFYDEDINLEKETITIDDNRTVETKYTYNYLGQPETKERRVRKGDIFGYSFETANDEIYLVTEYEYDYNGNLIEHIQGKVRDIATGVLSETDDTFVTSYVYDNLDRMTTEIKDIIDKNGNPVELETVVQYNWEGKKAKITYPNLNETEFVYDLRGFNTRIINKDKSSHEISKTALYYDLAGRLKAEVAPEDFVEGQALENMNRIKYDYDGMDRLLKKSYEGYEKKVNVSKTDWGNDVWVDYIMKEFVYDKAGNIEKEIDGEGNEIKFTYTLTNKVETILDVEGKDAEQDYTVDL